MSISRRKFLSGLAVGAGTLASRVAGASSVRRFAGYPGRYGLLFDSTLCVGCRSCEQACKEVNGLPPLSEADREDKSVFENQRRVTPDSLTVVNRYREAKDGRPAVYRKLNCMHCNEPCCATVCLVGAYTKTPEGPVLYDPEVCIGCRYCVTACPYYALSYEYNDPVTPRVMRCTMCYPRILEGKNPGCADACPTGAITFGRREDLIKAARERIAAHPDRYVDHIFGEHEFGGTSWMVLAGVPFGELGLPEGNTYTPLPEIGTAYLSVVPLVLTIYPGLLAGFYAFTRRKEKLSKQEAEAKVVEALMRADAETKAKLEAAAQRAAKDKERAVAAAVKKALEDAARKAPSDKEDGR